METGLPGKCVKKARGVIAFEEEAPLVYPLNHFPDAAVNRTSQTMVNAHRTKWPTEKMLSQHHVVRMIPITEVHYLWKNKQSSYFVYGSDHLVYAPRYPQRCCWTCSIL
ncbi:hypothetical protein LSH36_18g06018 [Paralvinella palmiformis]|uniref:Uncharacterized protein n=1 Tax=Paralvinella palmiformis TaxID=53620 RepID=A0AAD9KBY8_9ANNE|nr:hypothetical protein LSH36_18g06018 [Paralvinella palmiformis]